jgi:hypothetical protein
MFHKINKQSLIATTYLLRDALKLILLALMLILMAEAVLPGIVTNRINVTYIIILAILFFFLEEKLSSHLEINTVSKAKKRGWITPTVLSISLLLLIRSLIKFQIWQIVLITAGVIAIFFLIYKEVIHQE